MRLKKPFLQRLRNSFRLGVDMKLFIDVIDMRADGPDAYIAVIPDHFITVAIDQALQDGQFFRRKCIVIIGNIGRRIFIEKRQDPFYDRGIHGCAPILYLGNGFQYP